MAEKPETIETLRKERDDYRAAIIEYITEDMYGDPRDPRDIKVLVDALGKKRMER